MTVGSNSVPGRGRQVDPRVVRGSNIGYFTRNRIEEQKRSTSDSTISRTGTTRLPPIGPPTKSLRRRLKDVFERVSTWALPASAVGTDRSDSSTFGLDDNLIEKDISPKEKKSVGTEIDAFEDYRPPYKREPTLPPLRTGMDNHTQIEEKYVFDFDGDEVQREVIDVIADKTIQQSLEEVREEEEQAAIADFQQRWHERQEAERKKYEELEAIEVKRRERAQKLIREAEERIRARQTIERKSEALICAKKFSEQIINEVLAELAGVGRFADPLLVEAEQFLPRLTAPVVTEECQLRGAAAEATISLIHQTMASRRERLANSRSAQKPETALLRVFMIDPRDETGKKIPVGPVGIDSSARLVDVLYRIQRWIAKHQPGLLAEAAGPAFSSPLQLATTPLLELCMITSGELLHSTEQLFDEALTGKIAVRKKCIYPDNRCFGGAQLRMRKLRECKPNACIALARRWAELVVSF
ncbi:hypothetical protein FOZ63_014394 [Perkinsus olseni]|uniref:Radial spoke head protein 3 n=1 Tax=Perkinsus olseni TaxID=32597 RepID=A0A7J6SF13_PEROL|nr:hypothetical protein FOZ63_014394 [Perkinsus olseni]